ncbi:MAG: UDP-N-acetylmuramoyl-tripeptide--D-alanyl-D-alanine ligase [Peptococcaceae bacterium]|nr:UDP-N-acetylmuramoyl-tripeptide--D-alanyl-D-alanine ligase [Peptococcaceae bacterium]
MKAMSAAEIGRAIKATVSGVTEHVFWRVSTDTRTLAGGELFFALKGERFDGHNFVNSAIAKGAAGIVVSREVEIPPDISLLRVNDTLEALHDLARYNREQAGVFLIAITGSTGKTTTKDLVTAILRSKFKTLATQGNLNNEIGLPLTLLDLDESYEMAVVEMGMRGQGQIGLLCQIARPSAGVITNIGETHLEILGSVANIARAKGELLDYIPPDGFAVLNSDSPYMEEQAKRCRGKIIYFGNNSIASYRLKSYQLGEGGIIFRAEIGDREQFFRLPIPGRHNAINALAAIAVGREMGLSIDEIQEGLQKVTLSPMRLAILQIGTITVINDVYNANPASMTAALEVLRDKAGTRPSVAVLGDMLELGPRARTAHQAVGRACVQNGVTMLIAKGELSRDIVAGAIAAGMPRSQTRWFTTNKEIVAYLHKILTGGEVVLVKGSRGMHMEEVVEGLASVFGNGGDTG